MNKGVRGMVWNHFDYSRRYGATGVLYFDLNVGWRVTVV
jgi:hypothetical protein